MVLPSSASLSPNTGLEKGGERKPYLPELLRGVLASNALQDLGTARVLVDELGDIVDVAVDDDVEALVWVVVGGDVCGGEGFGHDCCERVAGYSI